MEARQALWMGFLTAKNISPERGQQESRELGVSSKPRASARQLPAEVGWLEPKVTAMRLEISECTRGWGPEDGCALTVECHRPGKQGPRLYGHLRDIIELKRKTRTQFRNTRLHNGLFRGSRVIKTMKKSKGTHTAKCRPELPCGGQRIKLARGAARPLLGCLPLLLAALRGFLVPNPQGSLPHLLHP